jgi:hypothetical protein
MGVVPENLTVEKIFKPVLFFEGAIYFLFFQISSSGLTATLQGR